MDGQVTQFPPETMAILLGLHLGPGHANDNIPQQLRQAFPPEVRRFLLPLFQSKGENIRDGIEDNEYFWLLRREIERLKATPGPEAYHALRQAEKAVRIGDDLVKNLQSFSKDPQAIYAKRRQVAEAILAHGGSSDLCWRASVPPRAIPDGSAVNSTHGASMDGG